MRVNVAALQSHTLEFRMTEDKKAAPDGVSETGGKADDEEAKKRAGLVKAGIGIGIGSAAIVAALLYSNHARKKRDSE
jgi:hypothetical protein